MIQKGVLHSPFESFPVPEDVSLADFLPSNPARIISPNELAMVCGETGVAYTRQQVLDNASQLASALLSMEFVNTSEKQVLIMMPNIPECFSIILGTIQAGLVPLLVNPNYTSYELGHILRNCEIGLAILIPAILTGIRQTLQDLGIYEIITVGGQSEVGTDYFSILKRTPAATTNVADKIRESIQGRDHGVDGHSTAIMVLSSGTTGLPKRVMLSHNNLMSTILSTVSMSIPDVTTGRTLTNFPIFHIGGLISSMLAFYTGSTWISFPKFKTDAFVKMIKKYKPTHMWCVPSVIAIIAAEPELSAKDFEKTSSVLFGSSSLSVALVNRFREKVGAHVNVQQIYGSTEASCFFTMMTPPELIQTNPGSVGVVVPNMEVKVVCTITGRSLGPGEAGEILTRGPQVMIGYYKNPEATRNAIDAEGWLHLGDYGHYDDKGLLYVDGRIKDLIKVHGYQVAPEEIENCIRQLNKVSEVVVFGIPNEKCGEVPRALIVSKDESLTVQDIHNFLQNQLVPYKHLQGGIEFVTTLPTNATGKILRGKARERYLESLA